MSLTNQQKQAVQALIDVADRCASQLEREDARKDAEDVRKAIEEAKTLLLNPSSNPYQQTQPRITEM